MQLDISIEPSDEALTMVLDNSIVLKVTLGAKGELVLNESFKDLEDENVELYTALRKITRELFELEDV